MSDFAASLTQTQTCTQRDQHRIGPLGNNGAKSTGTF